MKDSGVEWIGEIPEGWELVRLSSVFSERKEKVSDRDFEPLSVTKQGILPQIEGVAKTDNGDSRKRVSKGDFVINSRSDRKGSSGVSSYDGSVSLINIVLRPTSKVKGGYVHHLLRSYAFQEEFYRWGHGIVADLWTTNSNDAKGILLPLPEAKEQQRIADFLDTQTADIDASIAKTQESIEEYKKLKQAVITQAVTKGIRPGRVMKDSGVEWIGEIPEEWSIVKMRYLLDFVESGVSVNAGGGPADVGKIGVLKTSCVRTGVFEPSENKEVEATEIDRVSCPVKAGCLIVSRMNTPELVGSCGYVANGITNVFLPDRLWQIHLKNNVVGQFMWRYLNSQYVRDYYASIAVGSSSSMQNISQKDFSEIIVANPPMPEQQEIAAYLDEKCAAIDTLIEKKQAIITELEAYKKSLIYEYVTGKKEVPQEA